MNPGKLSRRILLKGLETVRDEGGGAIESYADKKSCWAHFRVRRTYRDNLADRDMNVCLIDVAIRDDRNAETAPRRGDVIECEGRRFSVESVSLPEKGYISMTCREET